MTLWGPTHLMLIGGAGMTLIGQAILLREGLRRAQGGGAPTTGDAATSVSHASVRRVVARWAAS